MRSILSFRPRVRGTHQARQGPKPLPTNPRSLMTHLIGLLHGQEETFPPALIEEINARGNDFRAESVKIGGIRCGDRSPYRVIVDRLSHRVPFFQAYLRHAAQTGTTCLNDPFWAAQQDRLSLARAGREAGLETLPCVALPGREHPPGVTSEDLGNLTYPLPWEEFLQEVGLPAVVRPLELGIRQETVVNSLRELWDAHARAGQGLLCLQRHLQPEGHLLCLTIGEQSLPLGYDPSVGQYRLQTSHDSRLLEQAARGATELCRRAGCAMGGVEFAFLGGKLYLTDLQLVPDLDWWSISERAFTQVVGAAADLALQQAQEHPKKSGGRKAASAGR